MGAAESRATNIPEDLISLLTRMYFWEPELDTEGFKEKGHHGMRMRIPPELIELLGVQPLYLYSYFAQNISDTETYLANNAYIGFVSGFINQKSNLFRLFKMLNPRSTTRSQSVLESLPLVQRMISEGKRP